MGLIKTSHKDISEIILIKEDTIRNIMEIKLIKTNHKEISEIILIKEDMIRNIIKIKLIKISLKENMMIINNLDLREKEKIFVNNSLKEAYRNDHKDQIQM